MKRKDAGQRVIRAAMRWYSSYMKIGSNWGYQDVPIRIENGLVSACAAVAAAHKRGRK